MSRRAVRKRYKRDRATALADAATFDQNGLAEGHAHEQRDRSPDRQSDQPGNDSEDCVDRARDRTRRRLEARVHDVLEPGDVQILERHATEDRLFECRERKQAGAVALGADRRALKDLQTVLGARHDEQVDVVARDHVRKVREQPEAADLEGDMLEVAQVVTLGGARDVADDGEATVAGARELPGEIVCGRGVAEYSNARVHETVDDRAQQQSGKRSGGQARPTRR